MSTTPLDDARLTELLATTGAGIEVPQTGPASVLAALHALEHEPAARTRRERPGPDASELHAERRGVLRGGRLRLPGRSLMSAAAVLIALAILPVAIPTVGLGGSGSDQSGGSTALSADRGAAPSEGLTPQGAPAPVDTARDAEGFESAPGAPVAPGGASDKAGPGTLPVPATLAKSAGTPTLVVRSASIEIELPASEVQATLARLDTLVSARGGFVAESRTDPAYAQGYEPSQDSGEARPESLSSGGTVVLRVPVAELDALVADTRKLPGRVVSYGASGADVSAAVVDLDARLKALRESRESYVSLLAEADSIAEVLAVRSQIDSVQSQIESLTAQVTGLRERAALATLTVRLSQRPLESETKVVGEWERAFDEGVSGFTGGVRAIVSNSGTVLINLLVLSVVFFAGRALLRLVRRRRL